MKKTAFTLAEVLITLGIIGIVAAMTLPSIVGNYKKKETVTLLKKTYSELNQAVNLSEIENGSREFWNYENAPAESNEFWSMYLFPYLKTTQVKYIKGSYSEKTDPALKYLLGFQNSSKVVLSSGVNLYFWGKNSIMIDLNGRTKPNMLGKDLFVFSLVMPSYEGWMRGENFVPYGWAVWRQQSSAWRRNRFKNGAASYADYGCMYKKPQTNYSNWFCAALIMIDGWEIKSDYPW